MGRVKEGSAPQRINIMNISLFLEESHCHSRQEHSRDSLWLCHGVQAWMWNRVCPQLCHTQPFITSLQSIINIAHSFSQQNEPGLQTIHGGGALKALWGPFKV